MARCPRTRWEIFPQIGAIERPRGRARASDSRFGKGAFLVPYRDSKDALQRRRDALKEEAARLRGRRQELEGVASREVDVERELFDVEAKLQGLRGSDAGFDLDSVKIASPCKADWNEMSGDDRSRYCGKCEKNVYNLSSMTRDEAAALIEEKEGKLCVRFFVREDGTMLTQDCPVGLRKKRVRLAIYGAAGAGLFATAGLAFGAPTATQGDMGAIALPVTPAVKTAAPPHVMGSVAPEIAPTIQKPPVGTPKMGAVRNPNERMGKPAALPSDRERQGAVYKL